MGNEQGKPRVVGAPAPSPASSSSSSSSSKHTSSGGLTEELLRRIAENDRKFQSKFFRGARYAMRVVIAGDTATGKTSLLERLSGRPFPDAHIPTKEINAVKISWNYKATDDIIDVDCWEVVEIGEQNRIPQPLYFSPVSHTVEDIVLPESDLESPTLSSPVIDVQALDQAVASVNAHLQSRNNSSLKGNHHTSPIISTQISVAAADARIVDVYRRVNAVVFMLDITRKWTLSFVREHAPAVPCTVPILIVANMYDMKDRCVIFESDIDALVEELRGLRAEKCASDPSVSSLSPEEHVQWLQCSLLTGFGLRELQMYLNIPFLRLKRKLMLEELQLLEEEAFAARDEMNILHEHQDFPQYMQWLRERGKRESKTISHEDLKKRDGSSGFDGPPPGRRIVPESSAKSKASSVGSLVRQPMEPSSSDPIDPKTGRRPSPPPLRIDPRLTQSDPLEFQPGDDLDESFFGQGGGAVDTKPSLTQIDANHPVVDVQVSMKDEVQTLPRSLVTTSTSDSSLRESTAMSSVSSQTKSAALQDVEVESVEDTPLVAIDAEPEISDLTMTRRSKKKSKSSSTTARTIESKPSIASSSVSQNTVPLRNTSPQQDQRIETEQQSDMDSKERISATCSDLVTSENKDFSPNEEKSASVSSLIAASSPIASSSSSTRSHRTASTDKSRKSRSSVAADDDTQSVNPLVAVEDSPDESALRSSRRRRDVRRPIASKSYAKDTSSTQQEEPIHSETLSPPNSCVSIDHTSALNLDPSGSDLVPNPSAISPPEELSSHQSVDEIGVEDSNDVPSHSYLPLSPSAADRDISEHVLPVSTTDPEADLALSNEVSTLDIDDTKHDAQVVSELEQIPLSNQEVEMVMGDTALSLALDEQVDKGAALMDMEDNVVSPIDPGDSKEEVSTSSIVEDVSVEEDDDYVPAPLYVPGKPFVNSDFPSFDSDPYSISTLSPIVSHSSNIQPLVENGNLPISIDVPTSSRLESSSSTGHREQLVSDDPKDTSQSPVSPSSTSSSSTKRRSRFALPSKYTTSAKPRSPMEPTSVSREQQSSSAVHSNVESIGSDSESFVTARSGAPDADLDDISTDGHSFDSSEKTDSSHHRRHHHHHHHHRHERRGPDQDSEDGRSHRHRSHRHRSHHREEK